jgi:hypothetical protein
MFKIKKFKFLLGLIATFVFLGFGGSAVVAQTPPKVNFECVGQVLAEYMNTVIAGKQGLDKIKLLSPVFNITATDGSTATIVAAMVGNNAQFGSLDAFAANTYTISGVPASKWYDTPKEGRGYTPLGQSWMAFFSSYNKKVIFTEYGDVDNPQDIPTLTSEFQKLAGYGTVTSTLFFNALNTNPDWSQFKLTGDQLNSIVGNAKAKAGINSAEPVTGGSFPNQVAGTGLKWELEIVNGPGDFNAARDSVNAAIAAKVIPILRICTGNSCGFGPDANNLVTFIQQLNAVIDGPVWIVAGPNEPNTELWATPGCTPQTVPFTPKDYKCNQVTEAGRNEFHSLRPYPGSPCNQTVTEQAMLCGNDLTVRVNYEVGINDAVPGSCSASPGLTGTNYMCNFSIPTGVQVNFNFNQSQLPIAGNTELVPNGYNTGDALSSKQRTNEYVSWYLNGVTRPAEEEKRTSYREITPTILDKVVNYSGPLRKLVPQRVQFDASFNNIRDALASLGGAGIRHDQIVGCHIPTALNASDLPIVCYFSAPFDAGRTFWDRLSAWAIKDLGRTNFDRLPPEEPKEELEPNLAQYLVDYKTWLAETCSPVITLPIINMKVFLCADSGRSSVWSSLYTYVPMSSTEDRIGQTSVTEAISYSQNDVQIVPIPDTPFYNPTVPSENLYFAHTEEDNQLSDILQNTYKAQGLDASASAVNPTKSTIPNFCEILKSRSNAGDNLWANFPKLDEEGVKGDLSFKAEFSCIVTVDENGNETKCKKSAWAAHMPVKLGAPKLDELWNRLVDGQSSIFKRIYPQIGKGSPITELKDLPASTFANYSSTTTTPGVSVNSLAGDPTLERGGDQATLYIPHLGGIYDYFLKGIQKALRPKDVSLPIQTTPSPSPVPKLENTK